MLSRLRIGGGTVIASALLAGTVLLFGARALPAQTANADTRWQAWLGCWEPAGVIISSQPASRDGLVCIIPAAGTSAVDIATIDSGRIVAREHIDANGERLPVTEGGCTGWQSAEWSREELRVYLRSESECEGGLKRVSSGILAMAPGNVLLDTRSVSARQASGVRVIRYREAPTPQELAGALAIGGRSLAVSTARTAAAAPLTTADVIEASRKVDAQVVEAWLIERQQKFAVDAKQLSALADASVPDRVIDAMVALSYPDVFAIGPARDIDVQAESLSIGTSDASRVTHSLMLRPYDYYSPYDYYYSPFSYTPFGYGYSPYGLGYGWYPGGGTVIVIKDPNGAQPAAHGRVVKGRGYTRGDAGSSVDTRRASDTRRATTPSRSGRSEAGAAPRSNAGGSATGRTAKPRPEP